MKDLNSHYAAARELIGRAENIVVLTGAGISAESGVPTFRDEDGLWKNFRPDELATPEAFARDARLVWEWYGWRRELIAACRPNEAHLAIARHAQGSDKLTVVTQNVDGLHAAAVHSVAGSHAPANFPVELHGSIFRARCTACHTKVEHRAAINASSLDTLPHCHQCGALLRPDIVWFGEHLDPEVLKHAMLCVSKADVCIVVGTSALVYPAAGLAALTLDNGGKVIEVNPVETPLSQAATISVRARATEAIPLMLD